MIAGEDPDEAGDEPEDEDEDEPADGGDDAPGVDDDAAPADAWPDSPEGAATMSGVAHSRHSDAVFRFSAPQFGHVFMLSSVLALFASMAY
jgi:hypothetical protein